MICRQLHSFGQSKCLGLYLRSERVLNVLFFGADARVCTFPRTGAVTKDLNDHIGPYKIAHLIGKGAMADVYLCTDEQNNPVAVKWLSTTHPPYVARFQKELNSLLSFQHNPPALPLRHHRLRHGLHAEEDSSPLTL